MKRLLLVMLVMMACVSAVSALPLLTDYKNVTTFTYNITPSMGSQTNYQIRFILSNSSGVSGYYAPDNIIYTNGITLPNWYDVNATDGSDNPLSFWIENNTQTSKNATAWVSVPAIVIGNTSTGKWYYGNSTQSSSTMSGYNTFLFFDDFVNNGLNTTQWNKDTTGAVTQSGNGFITVSGDSASYNNGITGKSIFNTTTREVIFRVSGISGSGFEHIGFASSGIGTGPTNVIVTRTDAAQKKIATIASGVGNIAAWAWTLGNVQRIHRVGGTAIFNESVTLASTTTTTDVPTVDLNISIESTAYSSDYVIMDWIAVRNFVVSEPVTSLYNTTIPTTAIFPPVASFTCTPTTVVIGNAIQCNDTSTNIPTNWTWYFNNGGNISTLQNPTYTYSHIGTYSVNLTVNNTDGSSWMNRSNYVNVHNASGFNQQDVYMTPHFTVTLKITDSTNAPIPVVTVTDSHGASYTTTNGTAFFTEDAGVVVFYFASTGYTSKSMSYIVDEDATHTVQLTTSTTSIANTNVIYTQRLVRLRAVDMYRNPLTPVTITASYIASTLPGNSTTEFLTAAFGITSDVAATMMDSGVAMSGSTGVDGSNTFMMFSAITYNLTISNSTSGVSCQMNLAPSDVDYVLYCPTNAQKAGSTTLAQTLNRSYIWITEPNASYVIINASYQDPEGLTTDVLFNVTVVDNNTVIYSHNFGNPGTSVVLDNYTMPNIRGMQIKSYLAYNRSTS